VKDLQELLGLLKEVLRIMPSQKRSQIKERGHAAGIGHTHKYHKGRPFQSYLLKLGKFHEKHGDTLEQAFPELAALAAVVAAKLKAILAMICPLAVLLRYCTLSSANTHS
jgi:hypothetical protein